MDPPPPEGCLPSRCAFVQEESGSISVMLAVSLIAVLGTMGLAIDVGQMYVAKQRLQTSADAAALAGALELSYCGVTANCAALQTAAQAALNENKLSGSTLLTNCATGSTTQLTLTVNNGPCALGTQNPHNGNVSYVETVISQPQQTYFLRLVGVSSARISVRAEAGRASSASCIYTLGTSGTDLLLNGTGSITLQTCGIVDDSSSSQALLINGNATLAAKSIKIVGSYLVNGRGSVTPSPVTRVASTTDPLASLAAPSFSSGLCNKNPNVVGGNSTLGPSVAGGTICYNGLTVTGNATVTLTPGLYIINGAMQLNGSYSMTGTGVTFYFPPGGSYTDNGNGTLNLAAPTSGTYNGILFYQSQSNSNQMTFNGATKSTLDGIFYLPGASLLMNGASTATLYTSIVAKSLTFNGDLNLNDYAAINPSSPLASGAVLTQ